MAWQKTINFPELHKKLYAVLKNTDPISKRNEDLEGVWKAIDSEGNVMLVAWWRCKEGRWHRAEKLALDAKQVSAQFAEEESGRPKPDQGWTPYAD
jgi:hypothetical protein